jgi:hypothetical protein
VRRLATALALLGLAGGALGPGRPAGAEARASRAPRATHAPARLHGLELGLADASFQSPEASLRDAWLARAAGTRASLVVLDVVWSAVAPARRPAGFDAADPADPAYRWERLDGEVRSAVAHGLQPVLLVHSAPAWAEGPNRPSQALAPAGTWLPDPQRLAEFAAALAARYSGRFAAPADPGAGALPQVRYFEIWSEENLWLQLNPLWAGARLAAPLHYREMLNAAYAAIHRADPGGRVIVGGLAPYGDAVAGGRRIPPVWFWRSLLCLRGPRLRPLACPDPAHFDIAAHNPIDVWGPSRGAVSPLDVSIPDLGRLTRIVRKALRTGRALPARPKPFWATEIWWDSRPPDPEGVPLRRHARFVAEALFRLWRQGVGAVLWWYLRDQAPGKAGYAATQQSGLLFLDGRPKPAYRAFRFPFVARRAGRGRVLLWGKAPAPGRLVVERRAQHGWEPLARPLAGPSGVFLVRTRVEGRLLARARQGRQASLPWRVWG